MQATIIRIDPLLLQAITIRHKRRITINGLCHLTLMRLVVDIIIIQVVKRVVSIIIIIMVAVGTRRRQVLVTRMQEVVMVVVTRRAIASVMAMMMMKNCSPKRRSFLLKPFTPIRIITLVVAVAVAVHLLHLNHPPQLQQQLQVVVDGAIMLELNNNIHTQNYRMWNVTTQQQKQKGILVSI